MSLTEDIMRGKGYLCQADGSFSRPDSHGATKALAKESLAYALGKPVERGSKSKETKPVSKSPLAVKFEAMWQELGGPHLTPEHKFHKTRKWRFDYAHLRAGIAIELEGGVFSGGRHTRPQGFANDCEKYNNAAAAGFIVFRLCTGMVKAANITPIIAAIRRKIAE